MSRFSTALGISALMGFLPAAAGAAVINTYTFTASSSPDGNSNWFNAGELTKVVAPASGFSMTSGTATNGIVAIRNGANSFYTHWVGAEWIAAEDEVVTQVVFSSTFYGGDYPGSGSYTGLSTSVYGGVDVPTETQLYTVFGTRSINTVLTNVTLNIEPEDGIRLLQFRAWDNRVGTVSIGSPSYSGNIQAITITTQVVPEPVAMGTASAVAAAFLLQRRRQ